MTGTPSCANETAPNLHASKLDAASIEFRGGYISFQRARPAIIRVGGRGNTEIAMAANSFGLVNSSLTAEPQPNL